MGLTDAPLDWGRSRLRRKTESPAIDVSTQSAEFAEQERDGMAPAYGVIAGVLVGLVIWVVIAVVWIAF